MSRKEHAGNVRGVGLGEGMATRGLPRGVGDMAAVLTTYGLQLASVSDAVSVSDAATISDAVTHRLVLIQAFVELCRPSVTSQYSSLGRITLYKYSSEKSGNFRYIVH